MESSLSNNIDPLQFTYRHNRFMADAISLALHSSLEHLEKRDTFIRLLFIDYSSAFNTINPSKLISKHLELGISTHLCNWILDFLTNRLRSVRIDDKSPLQQCSTQVPRKNAFSAPFFTSYTSMTVQPNTIPSQFTNFQTPPQWTRYQIMRRLSTGRSWKTS